MASVHEIGIAADTQQFERGVRQGIIKPLEDTDQALTDLGRNNGPDKLESNLRDVQRQSQQVGDVGTTSFRKIGEKGAEVGSELRQNLGETFASFRGDLSDLPQIAQDTLGGLAGSGALGGIAGIAATAAGAAGIGLIGAAITNLQAESEATKQIVSDNFRDMATDGITAWSSMKEQTERLTDAYDQHADDIKKISGLLKLPFETVAAAWAGNVQAIATVNAAYDDMKDNLKDTFGVSQQGAQATIDGWNGILKPLTDVTKGYDLAKQKAAQLQAQLAEMNKQGVVIPVSLDVTKAAGQLAQIRRTKINLDGTVTLRTKSGQLLQ